MIETEKAVRWFESRVRNTPMPGSREMYRVALAALEEKLERESGRSNGDCIRRMTDEELVEVFVNTDWCEECPYNGGEHCGDPVACGKGCIQWLKKTGPA